MPKSEVATPTPAELPVFKNKNNIEYTLYPNMVRVVEYVVNSPKYQTVDNEALMDEMMGDILDSEDLDAMFVDDGAVSAEDVEGDTLIVREIRYQDSDKADGAPFYAILVCTNQDKRRDMVVTCGARKLLAQAVRMDQIGSFPQAVQIKAKTTRGGNTVRQFVRPEFISGPGF